MSQSPDKPTQPRVFNRICRRLARWLGVSLLFLLVCGITIWECLFVNYSNLPNAAVRGVLSASVALGTIAAFIFVKKRRQVWLGFVGVFIALLCWFFSIRPSNDRLWQTDVAVLSTATINGNLVTLHNIRNFDYRTETDYTPRYYDKTFDLDKLESCDLIAVHWGSPAIAHIMASFGFGGSDFVCFSIETRKEIGETYSTVAGFFRRYELYYVVADERDVIRVRSNYRNPREDVYVYRSRLPIENQRKLFLDYIQTLDELAEHPSWYNAFNDNCSTGVFQHTRSYSGRGRFNWKILLSGYGAEYTYDLGMLDTSMPFPELRERSHINAKALAADQDQEFSLRIREGAPIPHR